VVAVAKVYPVPYVPVYDPYAVQKAAFAYTVADPDKESLRRQNQQLTEALVEQLRLKTKELQVVKAADYTMSPAGYIEPIDAIPPPPQVAYTSRAEEILQKNCAACHGGGNSKGDFKLPKSFGVQARLLVNDMINSDQMPPKRPLSQDDKDVIAEWAKVTRQELRQGGGN
jgi:mono/diheme cytochrome c family protein